MHALPDTVLRDTRAWVERAVIGLNLCPFAKAVHVKQQIHFCVSDATTPEELLVDLRAELQDLTAQPSERRDTTLLIAPHCLADFLDFNDFLARADRALRDLGLDGVLQIAALHPAFQFAGTTPDDISNYTNRAPYPTLHLLREESVDRAVAAFPNPETIFEANIRTLEGLGVAGWEALGVGASAPEPGPEGAACRKTPEP
jgi:hypothetical protein